MNLIYILLALLQFGIMITVHEYGHFISARMTGIAVQEFAVGFGPKLLQWKSRKHETLFTIRALPVGGYCMFYGDTDDDPKGEKYSEKADDPRNYNNAAVWKRMLSVVAGPVMNIVLAFLVAVALMMASGYTRIPPYISGIESGMPAEAAGLRTGDIFIEVDGKSMEGEPLSTVAASLASAKTDAPLAIVVQRDGTPVSLTVTPILDSEAGYPRIGIGMSNARPMHAGEWLPGAWNMCANAAGAIWNTLGKLFTTGEGFNDSVGPVGVVQVIAEQTQQNGFDMFFQLMILISINLGMVNMLPIPGLDGSRLVFMLLEAIRRKPVSNRVESAIHLVGYALLAGLMLFFTFRDVGRIFGIQ